MTPAEVLDRRIFLKVQALRLIRAELQDLQFRAALLRYGAILAGRIGDRFDPDLSERLDLVQTLIDGGRHKALAGGDPDPSGAAYSPAGGDGSWTAG